MVTSAIPFSPSIPAARELRFRSHKPVRYRLVDGQKGRYEIQRYDRTERKWFAVYSDDSAYRAFDEMKALAAIVGGVIVCPMCDAEIANPQINNKSVMCSVCDLLCSNARKVRLADVLLALAFVIIGVSVMAVISGWVGK
jgi:hypothetical protein